MNREQFLTDYFKEDDTIRVSCVELQEELREAHKEETGVINESNSNRTYKA